MKCTVTPEQIIQQLNLVKHCEGGYFYQSHCSSESIITADNKKRRSITSIYYLLTKESHVSYFAENQSDLILYHHMGDPLKIIFLQNDDTITEEILGTDLLRGEKPQVICPARICKAYDLMDGEYALVGEAVAPGFEYEDMRMPTLSELTVKYPHEVERLKRYCVK